MPIYEIKTTYREVSYGKCWITVEAESEKAALAQVEKGAYELDDYKGVDVESFDLDTDDIYWIEEVTKP